MFQGILPGRRIPHAMLAELRDGQITPISAADLLGRGRTLVIGVPGAFTPVCSEEHVPGLVANADKLRKSGFRQIVCIVASDPFVTDAWAKIMDPQGKVRFVSDGNLDFAREFGLIAHEQKLFLGDRSERYLFAVRDGVIEVFRLEQRITDYSCTASDDFVLQDV